MPFSQYSSALQVSEQRRELLKNIAMDKQKLDICFIKCFPVNFSFPFF